MSFTWLRPTADGGAMRSRLEVARVVHGVSLARGLDEFATVLTLMAIAVEVGAKDDEGNPQYWCPSNPTNWPESNNFPHDSTSDDNRSSGYLQQQPGPAGEPWWGTTENMMTLEQAANTFQDRLADDYTRAINNPTLAGAYVQRVQGSQFPDRYAAKWSEAWALVRAVVADGDAPLPPATGSGFTGDPVWLEEVLRAELGDRLVVEDGWADRGVGGTMGNIWGVMIHHTGNSRAAVATIRDGRPDLEGPLSNCLITPDGKCYLIAVGPCNHSGRGSYPGIPTNNGNSVLIGFECAWPDIKPDGSYNSAQRWPDAQIVTMRDATAAVLKKLGYGSDRVIGHKEYAGAAQGKWDPGNMDMNWFRGEVGKDLAGQFVDVSPIPSPTPPVPVDPPTLPKPANPRTDRVLLEETWDQLRGPDGHGWPMLGNLTIVESLAMLHTKVDALLSATAALKTEKEQTDGS